MNSPHRQQPRRSVQSSSAPKEKKGLEPPSADVVIAEALASYSDKQDDDVLLADGTLRSLQQLKWTRFYSNESVEGQYMRFVSSHPITVSVTAILLAVWFALFAANHFVFEFTEFYTLDGRRGKWQGPFLFCLAGVQLALCIANAVVYVRNARKAREGDPTDPKRAIWLEHFSCSITVVATLLLITEYPDAELCLTKAFHRNQCIGRFHSAIAVVQFIPTTILRVRAAKAIPLVLFPLLCLFLPRIFFPIDDPAELAFKLLLHLSLSIGMILASAGRERYHRRRFANVAACRYVSKILQRNRQNLSLMISSLLPDEVVERLSTNRPVVDQRPMSCIAILSVHDFENWTTLFLPSVALQTIDAIFNLFDHAPQAQGLDTITVLADTYVISTGLRQGQPEPDKLANFCVWVQLALENLRAASNMRIEMKIGASQGLCVGALTGSSKLVYELAGEAFDNAKDLTALCTPNEVWICEALQLSTQHWFHTAELTGSSFPFRPGLEWHSVWKRPRRVWRLLGKRRFPMPYIESATDESTTDGGSTTASAISLPIVSRPLAAVASDPKQSNMDFPSFNSEGAPSANLGPVTFSFSRERERDRAASFEMLEPTVTGILKSDELGVGNHTPLSFVHHTSSAESSPLNSRSVEEQMPDVPLGMNGSIPPVLANSEGTNTMITPTVIQLQERSNPFNVWFASTTAADSTLGILYFERSTVQLDEVILEKRMTFVKNFVARSRSLSPPNPPPEGVPLNFMATSPDPLQLAINRIQTHNDAETIEAHLLGLQQRIIILDFYMMICLAIILVIVSSVERSATSASIGMAVVVGTSILWRVALFCFCQPTQLSGIKSLLFLPTIIGVALWVAFTDSASFLVGDINYILAFGMIALSMQVHLRYLALPAVSLMMCGVLILYFVIDTTRYLVLITPMVLLGLFNLIGIGVTVRDRDDDFQIQKEFRGLVQKNDEAFQELDCLLRMLLPPPAIPLALRRGNQGQAGCIVSRLEDAAVVQLVISLPRHAGRSTYEVLEQRSQALDSAVLASNCPHVSKLLVFGDTVLIGGPLHPIQRGMVSKVVAAKRDVTVDGAAMSTDLDTGSFPAMAVANAQNVAELKLSEFIAENCVRALLLIVHQLLSTFDATAVFAIGDGFGACLGTRTPGFGILGFVTRFTAAITRAAPKGFTGTSEAFRRIATDKMLQETGFSAEPTQAWRVRGAGSVVVTPLRRNKNLA
jgi:hypothetical protein